MAYKKEDCGGGNLCFNPLRGVRANVKSSYSNFLFIFEVETQLLYLNTNDNIVLHLGLQ